MATFTIEPVRETLHGTFSREYEPILTIDPGDTVCFRTLDARWGLDGPGPESRRLEPRDPAKDYGHALCGPVAIRSARPGATLVVHIKAIRPGRWGWTAAGPQSEGQWLEWTLDPDALTGRDQFGREVDLRPFMGVMGLPPDEPGLHSTGPPRAMGGNMDCKELVAGSTLYLPIAVPDALFSVGDGHAVQGDGEISGTAIECPMERVELSFDLREDLQLSTPRAETPSGWITLGFDEDLDKATGIALEAMVAWMQERYGWTRHDTRALASLTVDLRITQIVNGALGVHALLPYNAIRTP